ncbi:MAG: exosortase/archaeosortase family protein [Deltaproteobacteria bacterium]|nr:exosortase/archaeosortase family protein [Deltaproteobacteria bacterium]
MRLLNWIAGINVVLAVLAYREFLRFQPNIAGAWQSSAEGDIANFMFVPGETLPIFVVLLSVWLLYRRRQRVFALESPPGPRWLVGLLFALAVAIFAWAIATDSADIQTFSLVALLFGIALAWHGFPAARALAVPILFLLFALPMPAPLVSAVVFHFQLWTAQVAGWLLYLLGIPALVSGEIIRLSGESFRVIETCSGLRSVETLTMLSIVMIVLFERRGAHALVLIALAAPVAFAMNGVRVLTLILNPHSEIHSIHSLQGVAVLMGGLLILYMIDGLLARLLDGRGSQPKPIVSPPERPPAGLPAALSVTGVLAACLLLSLSLTAWRVPPPPATLAKFVPATVSTWQGVKVKTDMSALEGAAFYQFARRRYRSPSEGEVDLFVGIGDHGQRFRSPFSPMTAFPSSGWRVERQGRRRLGGGEGPEVDWRLLRSGAKRVLAAHWYVGTKGLADEALRSLLALDRSPWVRPVPGVVVRMGTSVEGTEPEEIRQALRRLNRFYMGLSDDLEAIEEEVRDYAKGAERTS